jgi:hypothetical protein
VAEILTPQNFGEIGALESAENAEFFCTNFRNYAPVARNLLFDHPPPFLGRTPVNKVDFSTNARRIQDVGKYTSIIRIF